jgi:CRP-like cAMP-binding protein
VPGASLGHGAIQSYSPRRNHILGTLLKNEFERLVPDLCEVELPLGHVLYESGDVLSHVYFPVEGIVSSLYVMEERCVGGDLGDWSGGIHWVSLVMGGDSTPSRAVVQCAGQAFRMSSSRIKEEFARNSEVRFLLLRFMHALITQMAQTAVCDRHHSIEQKLCRWLLLSLDRLPSNDLTMTQELIANMLGGPSGGRDRGGRQVAAAGHH